MLTTVVIREAILAGRWAMSRHARENSGRRQLEDRTVVLALTRGELLEAYPEDPRGPSALILGYTEESRSLHAVCAFDPAGTLIIITVYEPTLPGWTDERTRARDEREV